MGHRTVVRCTALILTLISLIEGFSMNRTPLSARIIVHVSKRRATYWEPWEVNRRICPPSLCRSSDTGGEDYRPRGTAGTVFYQGDIILRKDDEPYIYGKKPTRRKRATMRLRQKIWKNGRIPYEIDSRISPMARRYILRAFNHIQERTCIKFKKRRNKDKDYVRYISEPGCWSNVGKRGGMQLISLGRGCENLGTTVHETSHALGMWHEQARVDRDRFVKILEENISPKYLPDFKVISRRAATSRGYPYDYDSVMHYNKLAFTRAGDPTIKVIGIGKKLGLKIGQRLGLSTIDMAQLREMYHCNQKEDSRLSSCPKGWVKHQSSCYKFHKTPPRQFSAANKECEQQHGHLLAIDSKTENRFIQKYIRQKYKNVGKWRTGGKLVNGSMVWFKSDKTKPKAMRYTNWDTGMPASYTTAVLAKSADGKTFKWQGVWAGSQNQLPAHSYPFICEKRAKRKCLKGILKDGRDYRGKRDHTLDGITCQKWSDQYPHQHKLKPKNKNENGEDSDGLGNHNYCRNPSGQRRKRPWCYTAKKNPKWQYCDITPCAKGGSQMKKNNKPYPRQRQTQQKQKKHSKYSGRITHVQNKNRSKKSLLKRNDRTRNKFKNSRKQTKELSKRKMSGSKRNTRNKSRTNANGNSGGNTSGSSETNTRRKSNQRKILKLKNSRQNKNSNTRRIKPNTRPKTRSMNSKQKESSKSTSEPSVRSSKPKIRSSEPKLNTKRSKLNTKNSKRSKSQKSKTVDVHS
ncbi:uncharacterized protein LOC121370664 [Gigantopelta aegis]|uniref:uncharacterized protein LOC121370664 n=1 Tax=Gigantopelta aegis TaxID=1735272 RepID=UPI001B887468|nr:uncharacterized protein LOC121370664 [Gigantopelta aegis]